MKTLDFGALRTFLGPLVTFLNNLMGNEGEAWWENFKRFLRKEPTWYKPRCWRWKKVVVDGKEINLFVFTTRELGFQDKATLDEIYARIEQFGLVRCPEGTAESLRAEYSDQPVGERLNISRRDHKESGSQRQIMVVGHDSHRGLILGPCSGSHIYDSLNGNWVFSDGSSCR